MKIINDCISDFIAIECDCGQQFLVWVDDTNKCVRCGKEYYIHYEVRLK